MVFSIKNYKTAYVESLKFFDIMKLIALYRELYENEGGGGGYNLILKI